MVRPPAGKTSLEPVQISGTSDPSASPDPGPFRVVSWSYTGPNVTQRRFSSRSSYPISANPGSRSASVYLDAEDGHVGEPAEEIENTLVDSDQATQGRPAGHDEPEEALELSDLERRASQRAASEFSESTNVPKRNLGFLQITSLILNLIVGTGIFTTPGYVLILAGSKWRSLVLWFVGGAYTGLSMLVFLEYGIAWPYNGGALIYLDEVFHWPRMLAAVLFAVHRITLESTSSNCRNLAINLLELGYRQNLSKISAGEIQFVAVVVQTVVCLLLYLMRRLCFVFNSWFAMFKVVLLLTLAVYGITYAARNNILKENMAESQPGHGGVSTLTAMIYIIFSYQGLADVNCVVGEIKNSKRTLKFAAITAISIVTILYILVTFAFSAVLDYSSLTNENIVDNIAIAFAEKVFGNTVGIHVAMGISSFSNILFLVYTTARVKQAIAWQGIIPFYRFFGRQDKQFDSPGGALFLHWIFSIIPLVTVNPNPDALSFALGIYSYGYQLLQVALAIGLLRIRKRMRLSFEHWEPTFLKRKPVLYLVAFLFAGVNILIMVMTALPHYEGDIPRYFWPVTLAAVLGVGFIYWSGLSIPRLKLGKSGKTIGALIGFEVFIYEDGDKNIPEHMHIEMLAANDQGSGRRLNYKIHKPLLYLFDFYEVTKNFIFKHFSYK